MSLATVIDNATQSAFGAIGDLSVAVTLKRYSTRDYNATTGLYTNVYSPNVTISKAVLLNFSIEEANALGVKKTRIKLLISIPDFPTGLTEILKGDLIVSSGSTYKVIDVEKGQSTYTVFAEFQS